MIIGNGLLARAFAPYYQDKPELTIFASGVSNSRETRAAEFAREQTLLQETCASAHKIVYFSTCSVHDPELASSAYVQHKLAMERIVASHARHAIFRLPQVIGHTPNPHTLSNFLYQHITQGLPFHIWRKARRNLIDIDDIVRLTNHFLQQADEQLCLNIACPFSISMPELLAIFERVLGRTAQCDLVDAGGEYKIDTRACSAAAAQIGLHFDANYLDHLITKYYAHASV